ncbi:MAG TPA: hypothetical protein VEW94_04755 [Chloroflexia bacterium]|nr:hypothetical protein [Chloroflexia bacterium]
MAKSEVQNLASAIATQAPAESAADSTYSMSREGRRQALVLFVGAVSIWVFALWTFVTILENGITGVEWVSSALMLGILLVAPMVGWALLEEAYSRVTTSDGGIRYRTLAGIDLMYSWEEIAGFKSKGSRGRVARFFLGDEGHAKSGERVRDVEADSDIETASEAEPETRLLEVRQDRTGQIANPLVRFLHRQAHGAHIPIFGGLENHSALTGEITSRLEGKS